MTDEGLFWITPNGKCYMSKDVYDERVKEIEDLKAQVEQLRKQKGQLLLGFDEYKQMQNIADTEIKAQAGRAGFLEGARQMVENEIGWFGHDAESCANHYANQIRQQAKNRG